MAWKNKEKYVWKNKKSNHWIESRCAAGQTESPKYTNAINIEQEKKKVNRQRN